MTQNRCKKTTKRLKMTVTKCKKTQYFYKTTKNEQSDNKETKVTQKAVSLNAVILEHHLTNHADFSSRFFSVSNERLLARMGSAH